MKREILAEPPPIQEHHVRLPDQLADILNATPLHKVGIRGRGIRIAVIDSGFFPHPFYLSRGYRITPVPTHKEKEPHCDEYGHGTAQLASLFSIAPEAEALVIKCMERDPSYALERAIELHPHVINCAWGFNIDHPGETHLPRQYTKMQKLILKAVDLGIVVVAAAGNGQRAFPGSMPEVISAGGVYLAPNGALYESDISSQYESSLFPGRSIPDLCGVVGNRPYGRLLLVPVPPRARLARRPGFATIAAGDAVEIGLGDSGWAMFSGTSAATSMISGASALLLQNSPGLSPAQIKRALITGARLVPQSKCKLLDVDASRSLVEAK